MNKSKTLYHDYNSCNACGERNILTKSVIEDGHLHECCTECETCSHKDYWMYGFFESMIDGCDYCKKYSFD